MHHSVLHAVAPWTAADPLTTNDDGEAAIDLSMWCRLGTQALSPVHSPQEPSRIMKDLAPPLPGLTDSDAGMQAAARLVCVAESAPVVRLLGSSRDEKDFVRRWNLISDSLPGHYHTKLQLDGAHAIRVSIGANQSHQSPRVARFLSHVIAAAFERMGGQALADTDRSTGDQQGRVAMLARPTQPIALTQLNGLSASDPLMPLLVRVSEAPDDNWGLERAAEMMHMSPRNFQRKLAQRGITWPVLLRALRLHAGIDAVIETHEPLTSIAHRCGFADSAHFSRVFKLAAGLPPQAYRMLSLGSSAR
ncbi:AraC family transcriptional regulator [Hydrogenophaga sp. 5NK40-0174]|uniref:helix-turn-helix transcriptional regulator n=1 Tax=Hydrogenophaga sp. 5NK40-0174 TaxID=3127649 RepID=UPI00310A8D04